MNRDNMSTLLACLDCGVLRPATRDDGRRSDAATAEADSAYDEFVAAHGDHQTARLRRHDSECRSDRPLWDPLATLTFEVTDGQQAYIVTAGRVAVDEPRQYQFTPGSLHAKSSEVAFDLSDIRRGLDREFFPHALRPSKVERFLSVLHEIVNRVVPDELPIAFDDANDPTVSIARMPDALYQEVLARCPQIFDPWECARVINFLNDNRCEDGLLALRVCRHTAALTA
jgi:hypothetical protein